MIERFNFYDVYGYLLPGAALLLVICTPFVLAAGFAPSVELSSAVVGSVVAYFLGHLLQLLSREALPSKQKTGNALRFPAAIMLDDDDRAFDRAFRHKLAQAIQERLGLPTGTDEQRNTAFEACRQHLQAYEVRSYAEQFQGLYALMRGLFAASVIGVALASGWGIGAMLGDQVRELFAVGVTLSAAVAAWVFWQPGSRWCFWLVALVAVSNGAAMGAIYSIEVNTPLRMAAVAVIFAVAARYFHRGNRFYTTLFARSVYLAFYAKAVTQEQHPRIPRRK